MAVLSPEQLAGYTLASDVLRDRDKAGKVFSSLSSHTIGDFMDAFNAAAKQVETLPPVQGAGIKQFTHEVCTDTGAEVPGVGRGHSS